MGWKGQAPLPRCPGSSNVPFVQPFRAQIRFSPRPLSRNKRGQLARAAILSGKSTFQDITGPDAIRGIYPAPRVRAEAESSQPRSEATATACALLRVPVLVRIPVT